MTTPQNGRVATRRKFLTGAAVAGAGALAFPQVSRAQTSP